MPRTESILETTLGRLESLYREAGIEPGNLRKIALKPGWIAVVGSRGECGTAFRFSGHTDTNPAAPGISYGDQLVSAEELKGLIGRNLMEIARENVLSSLIPLRSVGVAALSALSQRFLTMDALTGRGFEVKDDRDVLASVVRAGDVVALIGYGGMAQNLIGTCRELHVADMRSPGTLRTTIIGDRIEYAPGAVILHGADEDEAILSRSDVAILTASSLVNGTIDDLLRYSSKARIVGLYGPSASVIPDCLFERGVGFVMSHHISDPESFVDALLAEGNMESAISTHQRYQTVVRGRMD